MKRYAWLLVLVLGLSSLVWGDLYSPSPGFGSALNRLGFGPSIEPRGIEVVQRPWADISGFEEGISEVRITPSQPTTADEVFAAVSGWKPDPDYVLDYANVTMAGGEIRLDLHWHNRPPVPTIPPVTPKDSSLMQPQSTTVGGIGTVRSSQNNSIELEPVTQYVLSPFSGTRYQVRESLGTLAVGVYTLHIVSHDPVPGSASKTFAVHEAEARGGFPWGEESPLFRLLGP
ncbi:MAG: hypothetical protein GY842_18585 [bacterium]|nr:hypothetical protein [bacterium]